MGKPPDVPDLDLPSGGAPSRRPSQPQVAAPKPATSEVDDVFGGGIERGTEGFAPPTSAGPRGKSISVDFGVRGEDFDDDALERGGGYDPPAASSSRQPPISSRAPASMNLDVAYRRPTAPSTDHDEPGFLEKAGAHVLAAVGIAAAVAPLLKLVHHAGALTVTKLLPHAFDASSLPQSGGVAGAALVSSIAFGYLGIKARPRSWAMILSAFVFLLTSLAMVTVALVATEENPAPPDGARLIPYTLPLAMILLGLGVSARAEYPYLDGGAKRVLPFVAGLGGGLLIYAGIALSSF